MRQTRTSTDKKRIVNARPWRPHQPRHTSSRRERMIPSQYSVISLSKSRIPLIEFNPTPPWLLRQFQRIPIPKIFLLPQELGCKYHLLQPQVLSTKLLFRLKNTRLPLCPKRGIILLTNEAIHTKWMPWHFQIIFFMKLVWM